MKRPNYISPKQKILHSDKLAETHMRDHWFLDDDQVDEVANDAKVATVKGYV